MFGIQTDKGVLKEFYLVGGLEHFLCFHILGMSSSQLTCIFFRGVAQPPTSYLFILYGKIIPKLFSSGEGVETNLMPIWF